MTTDLDVEIVDGDAPPWEPLEERAGTPAANGKRRRPASKAPKPKATDSHLTARQASSVTPTKPEWLWPQWVLLRALNLLVGRQGAGKTTFAAHLTAGATGALEIPGAGRDPVRVGFLSLEEPDDRVVARLHAAGADLELVVLFGDVEEVDDEGHSVRRRWTLPKDVGLLAEAIEHHDVVLVIIDGLGYSISGTSHNYAVVGSALAALAGVADRTGVAILGLVHPPKGASDPVTAAIGSTAWTAIPRVSMVLGNDPHDESGRTRVVAVAKSNYKVPDSPLAFEIAGDDEYECGRVVGLRPTSVTAAEVMAAPPTSEERTERRDAVELLRELLAEGPLESAAVGQAAERAGVSRRTLQRARKDLGVVAIQQRSRKGRSVGWVLSLPGVQTADPDRHLPLVMAEWRSGRSGSEQENYKPSPPDRHVEEAGGLDDEDDR